MNIKTLNEGKNFGPWGWWDPQGIAHNFGYVDCTDHLSFPLFLEQRYDQLCEKEEIILNKRIGFFATLRKIRDTEDHLEVVEQDIKQYRELSRYAREILRSKVERGC